MDALKGWLSRSSQLGPQSSTAPRSSRRFRHDHRRRGSQFPHQTRPTSASTNRAQGGPRGRSTTRIHWAKHPSSSTPSRRARWTKHPITRHRGSSAEGRTSWQTVLQSFRHCSRYLAHHRHPFWRHYPLNIPNHQSRSGECSFHPMLYDPQAIFLPIPTILASEI